MPKQKTHKGLNKRVKVTATGKVKRKKAFSGHLMSSKSPKRRRSLSKSSLVHSNQAKTTRIMLCK